MKILYAADDRAGSFFQLKRFVDSVKNSDIQLKIAAYKKSLGTLDVDYTLDCLLNFTNPDENFSSNGNYVYYFNEIRRFAPDLIISDFEVLTSLIALELGIKLWQVSPLLLYYAIPFSVKYNTKINKDYANLFSSNFRKKKYVNYIMNNSDRRLVVSHLCDSDKHITLRNGFEWVRPDFVLADETPSDLAFVVARTQNSKNIINSLRNTNSVMFTEFHQEKYENLILKNIYDENEYKKQIGRCKVFITDGSESITSDAFYNQKQILFDLQHDDIESIIVSFMSEYFGIGKVMLDTVDADKLATSQIIIDDKVKFLHEELKAI